MKTNLLSIFILITFFLNAQDCSDLFISEYVEGPANNNGIEIYNPTNNSIDLSSYTINRYSNGSSSSPEIFSLSGSISAGDAIVFGNGQLDSVDLGTYWSLPVDPIFFSYLDFSCNGDYDANSTFYFNGDDAMTLEKNSNIIDVFGKVGEDPGSAWTDDATAGYTDANGGTWWTKRQTLVRKYNIRKGVNQNPIVFNPTIEWDSLPDATYNQMGQHSCDCITSSTNINNEVSYWIYQNTNDQSNSIRINSKIRIKNVEIFDILGNRIGNYSSNKIPTINLSKGIYLYKIQFVDGRFASNKLTIK
ncbi:MAG: hypothetical protein CMP51_04245 [Flavobacteriales bacterium]|nr:hypothetical protein [Flavobacteriales bacterium]|tara:strand:+ start:1153 stop:2064 length:912 start_codon:yes stop_codon:yes gene_type:complete